MLTDFQNFFTDKIP